MASGRTTVPRIALRDGTTIPQLGNIVIPKFSRPERMAENTAVFDVQMSADEMAAVDARDRGPDGRGLDGRVGPRPATQEG